MKSRFLVLAVLWTGAELVTGLSAEGQTIADYTPTRVAAGEEVAISGEGFSFRTREHSIKFSRGSIAQGDAHILSWETTGGATAWSRVRVRLPGRKPLRS